MSEQFVEAIALCITYPEPATRQQFDMVAKVLRHNTGQTLLSHHDLTLLQAEIDQVFPQSDQLALVYGGATKIKGYVFEAPKLPEIRGASALLDWINEAELPLLWGAQSPDDFGKAGIIYSSGGSILAFAPVEDAQRRAAAIEQTYTKYTLTANSVAVTERFSLIELRYGRNPLSYWIDEFTRDWANESLQELLSSYYYLPKSEQWQAFSEKQQRFYNRKTFGELVTLLATMANQRRDERSSHGEVRSIPFYQLTPWAEKCQSSDIRPVTVQTMVGEDTRLLSSPSGRKLIAGRLAKRDFQYLTTLEHDLGWKVPPDLIAWERSSSWEKRWEDYIYNDAVDSFYGGKAKGTSDIRPAKDVHEIGAASNKYIGIIYADGNNVGRLMATLTTPGEYAAVSKALSNAARLAVFQALADFIEPIPSPPNDNQKPLLYPFEILTIGGDDLFLIVPGNKAFDIAVAIGRYFEKLLADSPELKSFISSAQRSTGDVKGRYADGTSFITEGYVPSIGLSAGVIVAQETSPIFFLRDFVEQLLKTAKNRAKTHAGENFYGGAVDFMVMKSIAMVTDNIKSFRRHALGDNDEKKSRRLTARPYSWHEFAGLLETVRQLKRVNMPRSQLYRLREALDTEPGNAITPSVMEYLYTRTRLSPTYSEALRKYIEEAWCWDTPIKDRTAKLPPWMPREKSGWETIWPDLLEIYDMVPVEISEVHE